MSQKPSQARSPLRLSKQRKSLVGIRHRTAISLCEGSVGFSAIRNQCRELQLDAPGLTMAGEILSRKSSVEQERIENCLP
jgi:hypothetical protein